MMYEVCRISFVRTDFHLQSGQALSNGQSGQLHMASMFVQRERHRVFKAKMH
jgi:hypothetical protein